MTPHRARHRVRIALLRLVVAAGSGWLLYLSFPPRTWWWLALLAFAGLGLALHGARGRTGLLCGLLFGLVFSLPHLAWLQDFLGEEFGPWPWLGLSLVVAAYAGVAGAAMAWVGTLPGGPVWMAGLFVAQEWLRSTWPLGGFPWGRVAFGQPDGWYASLAAVGGAPLVTFAVVVTGFLLAWAIVWGWRLWRGYPRHRRARAGAACGYAVAATVPLVAAGLAWPSIATDATVGTLDVAVVQGNAPDAGLDLLGARETIRDNHIAESERLLGRIAEGTESEPELVVWPETATDLATADPTVDDLVTRFDAPALLGAMYFGGQDLRQNTVIEWSPETGPGQRYAKQELVPFSEYIPLRPIAGWFTPFLDHMVDMTPGTGPAVLDGGDVRAGVAICYEAAYDGILGKAAADGVDLLVVPTNNAWFGRGEMSHQHLAMSRLRAIEHGRATVVAATSGISAIVDPDGSVRRQTGLFTAESFVETVPLRDEQPLATAAGPWPERTLAGAGVLALLLAVGLRIRDRSRRRARGVTGE
ncbi:apolipoprotein N-acyltransferase [Haloechinothrix sp. LS1_15]|nr:apolipoprotein N-acyltransferase [Haloechinothrix sp. LS1_15]